ncbi:(deoxy)nucleoside triphosphate pyrophosphohydrolase [Aeromicrobium sp.]
MAAKGLVVGGLIVDDLDSPTQILAARRIGPPSLRGKWEFPGGKVEADESPEEALVRELEEELDVVVVLGDELFTPAGQVWQISDALEMRLWFAAVTEGAPSAVDSHDELRWLDADTLESVDWLDADRQVLPHVISRLSRVAATLRDNEHDPTIGGARR